MSAGSRIGAAAANLLLIVVSSLISLAVLEGASRILLPIAPATRFLTADGRDAGPIAANGRLVPNLAVHQVSPDYDVPMHTGPLGIRAPEPDAAPEIIFLGDSFTFGQGLADQQTFAALYCNAVQASCANLGIPGTGTLRQRITLDTTLAQTGWHPREVKLFMLAVTSSMASGNDLFDTLYERDSDVTPTGEGVAQATADRWTMLGAAYELRGRILAYSNLARIAYSIAGPWLRANLSPPPQGSQLEAALAATAEQLRLLADLADRREIRLTIYLLHPMQDLLRGTYPDTFAAIQKIAGAVPVVDTAPALLDGPRRYYYPYDGHFNVAGASRIAEFLKANDAPAAIGRGAP